MTRREQLIYANVASDHRVLDGYVRMLRNIVETYLATAKPPEAIQVRHDGRCILFIKRVPVSGGFYEHIGSLDPLVMLGMPTYRIVDNIIRQLNSFK